MTVVLDCNILVMSLSTHSPYYSVYESLIQNKFNLVLSYDIMLEYEEIINHKYGYSTANSLMSLLAELPNVHFINPNFKWQLIEVDPDDNKYCDCAIAGQADHIVTEDRHFDIMKNHSFPSVSVISIDTFIEILKTKN